MFPRLRDFGARPLDPFEEAYRRVAKLIAEDRYGSIPGFQCPLLGHWSFVRDGSPDIHTSITRGSRTICK